MDGFLVVFDLEEEVSAALDDLLSGSALAVQRVCGDQRMGQVELALDQALSDF